MPIALPAALAAEALAGFLIIAAALAIALLVAQILGALPVVGGSIGPRAQGLVLAAIASIVQWSNQAADGLASAVQGPWIALWHQVDGLITQDWRLGQALYATLTVTVPNLRAWTWSQVSAALGDAYRYTDARSSALTQYVLQWAGVLTLALAQAEQQLENLLEATRVAIVAWVLQWVALLLSQIAAGDAAGARYAEALAAQSVAYTAQAVGAAMLGAEAGIQAEAQRADQELRQVIDWAEQGMGQLGQALAAAAAADAAYALALVAPVAQAVQQIEDSPCMQACSALGDIGSLLQGLEDAGLQALLLAVLAEVESDPAAVQQVLARDFAPIFKDALGALV